MFNESIQRIVDNNTTHPFFLNKLITTEHKRNLFFGEKSDTRNLCSDDPKSKEWCASEKKCINNVFPPDKILFCINCQFAMHMTVATILISRIVYVSNVTPTQQQYGIYIVMVILLLLILLQFLLLLLLQCLL